MQDSKRAEDEAGEAEVPRRNARLDLKWLQKYIDVMRARAAKHSAIGIAGGAQRFTSLEQWVRAAIRIAECIGGWHETAMPIADH